MAELVLLPCKLRDDWIVPAKGGVPTTFDWDTLAAKLAPPNDPQALRNLRQLQASAFIGLIRSKRDQRPVSFFLLNPDRTGTVGWLLKKDPSFTDRLLEVYRVESVVWDGEMKEHIVRPSRPDESRVNHV